jgi:hypothetical protein
MRYSSSCNKLLNFIKQASRHEEPAKLYPQYQSPLLVKCVFQKLKFGVEFKDVSYDQSLKVVSPKILNYISRISRELYLHSVRTLFALIKTSQIINCNTRNLTQTLPCKKPLMTSNKNIMKCHQPRNNLIL